MLFINRDFYSSNDIFSFINASVQILINQNPSILATNEYKLFFYIKEDFSANFFALYSTDIDMECLGFSVLQRNTRHAIEAFLDLLNLSHDPDYLSVMEHCADRKKRYNPKYNSILQGKCTIYKKYEIATKMYNENIPQELVDISSETNNHTHPNVFVDVIGMNEYDKKATILRNVLNATLYALISSYQIILKKFNNNIMPTMNCTTCRYAPFRTCNQCFTDERARFQNLINNALFTYSSPFQNVYYQ